MDKTKIMVVEDEAIVAHDIARQLQDMGYEVAAIEYSGEAAIEKAEQAHPDLILMDIVLAGKMDGIEAADIIRSRMDIPVIFLTAYADQKLLERAKLVYPYGYILKPFQGNELKVTVEMALHISKIDGKRRKAEKELRASEERHRAILQTAMDGILRLDEQGCLLEVNETLCRESGYSESELLTMSISDLVANKKGNEIAALFREIMRRGDYRFETQHRRKDGTVYDVEVSVQYRPTDGGQMIAFLRNITERKRAGQELQQLASRNATILAAVPDIIMEVDGCKRYTWSNQAGLQFFGEDVVGQEASYYFEGAQETYHKVQPLFDGVEDVIYLESWQRRKDGEKRILAWWCKVLKDKQGQVTGALSTARDVTEQKEMEKVLRDNEERFRAIFERSTVGKSITSPEGKLLQINQALAHMLGYAIEEIRELNFAEITHPDDVGLTREYIRKLLAGEQASCRFEKRFIHKSGEIVWVDLSSTLLRDEQGAPLHLITSIVDITNRKRAEEQLQHTLESLRKAVNTTIQIMVATVEARDPYTAGHQVRSANLARAIATEMGLPQEKVEGIHIAGSIHDIGKISIPAEILSKPTKLSDIEFSLLKEHSRRGYEMLKDVPSPWPLAEIVYQHHERMDGSGYPRHLKGEEILLEARILDVADVMEAMASHRPYRAGLGIKAALNEIEKNSGTLYDSTVADACLKLFREKGLTLEGIRY